MRYLGDEDDQRQGSHSMELHLQIGIEKFCHWIVHSFTRDFQHFHSLTRDKRSITMKIHFFQWTTFPYSNKTFIFFVFLFFFTDLDNEDRFPPGNSRPEKVKTLDVDCESMNLNGEKEREISSAISLPLTGCQCHLHHLSGRTNQTIDPLRWIWGVHFTNETSTSSAFFKLSKGNQPTSGNRTILERSTHRERERERDWTTRG